MTTPVTVHIKLLDEGTPTWKMVDAIPLGNALYKLLPDKSYSVDLENWEFLPGAIVRCELFKNHKGIHNLLVIEQIEPPSHVSNIYVQHTIGDQSDYKLRKAISLGKHIYKLLAETDVDTSDIWEFPANAVVLCEDGYWNRRNLKLDNLVAVERVG